MKMILVENHCSILFYGQMTTVLSFVNWKQINLILQRLLKNYEYFHFILRTSV